MTNSDRLGAAMTMVKRADIGDLNFSSRNFITPAMANASWTPNVKFDPPKPEGVGVWDFWKKPLKHLGWGTSEDPGLARNVLGRTAAIGTAIPRALGAQLTPGGDSGMDVLQRAGGHLNALFSKDNWALPVGNSLMAVDESLRNVRRGPESGFINKYYSPTERFFRGNFGNEQVRDQATRKWLQSTQDNMNDTRIGDSIYNAVATPAAAAGRATSNIGRTAPASHGGTGSWNPIPAARNYGSASRVPSGSTGGWKAPLTTNNSFSPEWTTMKNYPGQ